MKWEYGCCPPGDGLSWYDGDLDGRRGFEVEVTPADEQELWSTGWQGEEDEGTWVSNLPDAYGDDLFSDPDIKNFAVGTARGRSLELAEPGGDEEVLPRYSLGQDPEMRAMWGACPPPYDTRLSTGECGWTW